MDDDVKNLFQKFGQSTDGYQEINRHSDSEQAKQRWPLLRDVHLHPVPMPVRADTLYDDVAPQRPLAERQEVNLNQVSAPIRQSQESVASPVFSLKEVSSRMFDAAPVRDTKMPATGIFAQQATALNEAPQAQSKSLFSNSGAVSASASSSIHSAPMDSSALSKPSSDNLNQANGIAFLNRSPNAFNPVSGQRINTAPLETDSKNHSIDSVFNRLAGKTEQAKPAESGVNSFFKKIFKP